MLTPREKSLLREKFSSAEDRTHDAVSSSTVSPTHYQRAIPAPENALMTISIIISMGRNSTNTLYVHCAHNKFALLRVKIFLEPEGIVGFSGSLDPASRAECVRLGVGGGGGGC